MALLFRALRAVLALVFASSPVFAQSMPETILGIPQPTWRSNTFVPTPYQWENLFAYKQDYAGANAPIGNSTVVGTGASASPTMSNRVTDFGVTFDLKTDFGAACNGSTDDTAAIQNWLNKAGPGIHLVAPSGTCNFSAHLAAPLSNGWSLAGAGQGATIFQYTGPNYNGTVAAGASWSAAAATITLSSATIPAAITAALAANYPVYVLDTQGVGSSVSSPGVIGTVATIVGTTLTLNAGATVASQGSGDSLLLATDVVTIGGTSASTKNVTLSGFTLASTTSLTGA